MKTETRRPEPKEAPAAILKQDAMNDLKDQPTHTLVPLPECPITASPVPWLTSIHATPGRGQYGNAGYRGNCSGLLIRDLLMFYRPQRVLDCMEGGGTCRAVLAQHGKLAVLMGDGKHAGQYMGLPFRTLNAAEAEGYRLAAPEIIRFGHGSTSSRRVYATSFIPRLHDVCLVLEPTENPATGADPKSAAEPPSC